MARRKDGVLCTATAKSTGNRCGNPPLPGGKICRFHGGKAPQVLAASARNILESLVGPALTKMREILNDVSTPPAVRLAAIRDILDRTGYKPAEQIEITFEQAETRLDEEFAELVERYEAMEKAESESSDG